MGIYTGSGGTARQVSKLYIGVDGAARQVQKMYVGVDGQAKLVYQNSTPLSDKAVGSVVKIKVNGVAKDFIVVHQGRPSTIYDTSCTGTWLLMKDIYTTMKYSSTTTGYGGTKTHTYLNGTFYNLIDSSIRDSVKQVKIPHNITTIDGSTLYTGSKGLSTKVFLLSGYEVGLTTSDDSRIPKDGAKLSYFSSGSSDNSKRIAYNGGSAAEWWLRSQNTDWDTRWWTITSNGSYTWWDESTTRGIRPAFILPQNILVDESGNIIV